MALGTATVLAAPPTVSNPIPNQTATENVAFNFQFAANTFADADLGDSLTFTAQLNGGGALPGWLSFNTATRTFSGTPSNGDLGTISIDVTADDGNGGTITDAFNIVIYDGSASTCSTYGMGDSASVCQISDCDQLFALGYSADVAALGRSYRVTANLTCPGDMQAVPIGSRATPFTGTFDGGNHTIEYLNIDAGSSDTGGLFGGTDGATISNVNLFYTIVNRSSYMGALIGEAKNGTTIKNVHSTYAQLEGANSNGGGLVGRLESSSISYSSVTSAKVGSGNGELLGGLVGAVIGDNSVGISNSYVRGGQDFGATVVDGHDSIGGLVGFLQSATIENVYAQANLNAVELTGGLVGQISHATIRNAYSTGSMVGTANDSVGGLVGDVVSDVTLQNTFTDVSGTGTQALYGTQQGSLSLIKNFYANPSSISTCNAYSAGQEDDCGYAGGANGDWLSRTKEPMASWDTWTTWNLHPSSGSLPVLLAEGEIASEPFDGGNGQVNTPYLISNCRQLQHMQDDLDAYYRLNAATIDCSETKQWHGGKGFNPIGDNSNPAPFTGNFDGDGKTISNLYIDRVNDSYGEQEEDDESFVGLFGYIQGGSAYNVNLTNARVRGFQYVGGLVGVLDNGAVDEVDVNVDIDDNSCGTNGHCVWARYGMSGGGIAGHMTNSATILRSNTGGPVKGSGDTIGGIVGWAIEDSIIEDVSSSSSVDGGYNVGGIVGLLESSSVVDAFASGDVMVVSDDNKVGDSGGGLVGSAEDSSILDSYASGDVSGRNSLGGLIGYSQSNTIDDSSASGDVDGSDEVGGLVGSAKNTEFSDSDAYGDTVVGDSGVGGFAGMAECQTTFTDSSATPEVSGNGVVGGFTGFDMCGPGLGVVYENVEASGDVYGSQSVGGFTGESSRANISKARALGDVHGVYDASGFSGRVYGVDPEEVENTMVIDRSYATGQVTSGSFEAAGFVGYAYGATITDSYSRSIVNGVAGLAAGFAIKIEATRVSNVYSTGSVVGLPAAGLVLEADELSAVSGFWNTDKNILNDAEAVGTGVSESDLKTQSTFTDEGWDFESVWGFSTEDNDGFACLRWTSVSCLDQDGEEEPEFIDANGDNIDDASQRNVISFMNGISGKTEAIELTEGCEIDGDQVAVREEKQFAAQDAGFDYGSTFIRFAANNCAPTISVKLFYYGLTNTGLTVRKHNPTTHAYFNVPGATISSQTINNTQVLVVNYQLDDNGILDLNPASGSILDPVGLGSVVTGTPNTGFNHGSTLHSKLIR